MADVDLKQFVDGLKGLTPDQRAAFDTVLATPENAKYVGDSILMKPDYSRKMNELSEQRTREQEEYTAKEAAMLAHEQELVDWKTKADDQLTRATSEKSELLQRLQAIAAGGVAPATPAQPVKAAEATPGYVTLSDFQKAVNDVNKFPFLAAELVDLGAEHQELFGKPLKNVRGLIDEAVKNKCAVQTQWANQYKVEERRTEVAKATHDAEITRVREEERQKVLSEHSLPAVRPTDRPLIVGEHLGKPGGSQEHPDPMRGVRAAVESYNAGTYAVKRPGLPNQ